MFQVLSGGTGLGQRWHTHVTVVTQKEEVGTQEPVKTQENGMGGPWSVEKVIKPSFMTAILCSIIKKQNFIFWGTEVVGNACMHTRKKLNRKCVGSNGNHSFSNNSLLLVFYPKLLATAFSNAYDIFDTILKIIYANWQKIMKCFIMYFIFRSFWRC